MNLWQQNYDPAGNIWLSSLIASLPILFFFFALIKLKLKGYLAATWTVAIALAVALLFYKIPVDRALASVVYGFFYGLWPIAWIIIAAVFVYKISVKTGQFDIIRSSILSITPDQRLQMLIVGFSFGAFLEGAAGFGAPVAITAALLVGLGFNPLYAAGLCLIVNTAPVDGDLSSEIRVQIQPDQPLDAQYAGRPAEVSIGGLPGRTLLNKAVTLATAR